MICSPSLSTRPRNPCHVDSRWRKHSFFEADYDSKILVTEFNATSYLVSIDGIPRTIIVDFRGKLDNGELIDFPTGNYQFSGSTQEYVGGEVGMNNGGDWFTLNGGNPPLYLPPSIIDQYSATIKTIQLPDRQYFQDVSPAAYSPKGPQFYRGAGIVSTVNLTDPLCETTTGRLNLIGIFPDNDQWYYDARIVLDRNSVDEPLPDGGGTAETLCSNVAKNFLNRTYNHI